LDSREVIEALRWSGGAGERREIRRERREKRDSEREEIRREKRDSEREERFGERREIRREKRDSEREERFGESSAPDLFLKVSLTVREKTPFQRPHIQVSRTVDYRNANWGKSVGKCRVFRVPLSSPEGQEPAGCYVTHVFQCIFNCDGN